MKHKTPVAQSHLPLPLLNRGKVRDVYEVGNDRLLIVTTDRLSAFDVVLPNPIPDKGKVLNQISLFWFEKFKKLIPNHLIASRVADMGFDKAFVRKYGASIEGRSVLVHRARPLPVECVVRGYLAGSGWKDYQKSQAVCGHKLSPGLRQCGKLPKPLFTPTTKAQVGHDMNIDFAEVEKILGKTLARKIRDISIKIYQEGSRFAHTRGILIADTKFEFGIFNNEIMLIDEVLTPDSSRFWPKAKYRAGSDQPSYDKQIVRNYLLKIKWNQTPPGPKLPAAIIEKTSKAYRDVYKKLTGRPLS